MEVIGLNTMEDDLKKLKKSDALLKIQNGTHHINNFFTLIFSLFFRILVLLVSSPFLILRFIKNLLGGAIISFGFIALVGFTLEDKFSWAKALVSSNETITTNVAIGSVIIASFILIVDIINIFSGNKI